MSRLPSLTPKKVIAILKKHSFQLDHSTGSHFVFYHPQTKKRVIVPFHSKDIPRGTLLSILKQAGIYKENL